MLKTPLCFLFLCVSGCTAILGDFSAGPPTAASEHDDSGVLGDTTDASQDARPDAAHPSPPDASAGDAPPMGDGSSSAIDGSTPDAALADASRKDADLADATSPVDAAVTPDGATDAGWDAWSLVCTATFQNSITPTIAACQQKLGVGVSYTWYCVLTSTGTANTPCYECGVGVACLIPSPVLSVPAAAGVTSLP